MTIEVFEFVSVSKKLQMFGIKSADALMVLPDNLDAAVTRQDLRLQTEGETVKTIFRRNNLPYFELFQEDDNPVYIQNYSSEWFGPTLFISASILTQNPHLISVGLGLITNYLTDIFKGANNGTASLNVVFENSDGSCKRINYQGSPAGLKEIAQTIRALEK